MLKWRGWLQIIYFDQEKEYIVTYQKLGKVWNDKWQLKEEALPLNCRRVIWIIIPYAQHCEWRWTNLWEGCEGTNHSSLERQRRLPFLQGLIITTNLLTYSMVQSPSWEANWFAASQEIPRISRNSNAHYRTHKRPTPVSILGHPIQSIYPHPTSWKSILTLSTHLRLGLPSGLLPSGFPTKTLYTPLSSPIRATCPAHHILRDFITRTTLGEVSSSRYSLLFRFVALKQLNIHFSMSMFINKKLNRHGALVGLHSGS